MYTLSAKYYDTIYSWKDYAKESRKLHRLIQQYKQSKGNQLLDVGCGTGEHLTHLRQHYQVEGLDQDPAMLRLAKRKQPDIPFHRGDMASFHLGHQFDIIVSLFSGIGHVKTRQRLYKTAKNLARHLNPGGVLIVEPWITPEAFKPRSLYAVFVNQPKLKIARINTGWVRGRLSIMDMHHLIGTPGRVKYFTERLEMGLFTNQEYRDAIKTTGLKVVYDPKGLMGRGLYIGAKPLLKATRR